MSTIQVLINDLNGLSTDAKRRFSDIRKACEIAVTKLKSYPPTTPTLNISGTEDKKTILKPFILACKSGNIKLTNTSTPVIHKLILSHLVVEEDIHELLHSLHEASSLAVDVQLRILQCLPALMQTYKLSGDNLLDLLSICSSLTANNKSPIVINAASATLQQLFTGIYDNINDDTDNNEKSIEIKIDNDEVLVVDETTYEGFMIFQDVCRMLDNEKPDFLKESIHIKLFSVLEVIESVVHGHKQLFQTHKELAYLLRTKVFPSLVKILNSPTKNFPLIDRTVRIMQVLLSTQLSNLEVESEVVLSFFSHLLLDDSEAEQPIWEKTLVLEMLKNLFSDFSVVKSIFEKYDNNKQRKNVLKELFTVITVFLQKVNGSVNDTVRPVSAHSTKPYLSRTTSNMKPSVLDHLDKSEPPSDIPTMYPVYLVYQILVSLSQGMANYVYNLNEDSKSPNILEADVELANALVEKATPDVSVLYEMLIYTSMDDETFFALIKSFQKFIHAAGLLGLNEQRDQLLLILCKATIKNTGDKSEHQHAEGTSFQEQKKQLLAFGEQLVESISSTIAGEINDTDSISSGKPHVTAPPALHSRYFNSRHVVCLRVLSNTAITLKSTLQDFWSVIWITFQWCDYYLNGPDAFSGFHNHKSYQGFTDGMKPQISAQDVNHIDSALAKLVESISDSSVEVFRGSLATLSHLTDVAYTPTSESTTVLDVSPYNKTYFMNKVVELCEDDVHQWLIKDDESWDLMSKYFVDGATKRTLSSGLRSSIVEKYTHVIESVAVAGFKHDELIDQTSARTLNGMSRYLEQISEMGSPQEVLIANCETEIHLSILTTLHNLIDKYDKNYQQSWHEVFNILNTPFKVNATDNVTVTDDGNTRGKLIEKSFDSLKLILDEFLSTLPFTQFKLLIDTLAKFVYQKHDLNISFTSVSYFWSISDALKSRMTLFNSEKGKTMPVVEAEEELVEVIERRQESYASYICLDVYLLLSLSKISRDEVNRAQVRDGAIQTFFQIIDVHGNLLEKSWRMVYKIVLSNFFSIVPESRTTDWIESLQLVLSGFISLYNKYLMNDDVDGIVDKWEQLLGYIEKLLHLQWIDLNLQVFKSLQDLMIPFDMRNKDIRHLFFKIWSEFPIEYDLVNANYQESLVQFMKCFPPLYRIIEKEISVSEVDTVVGLFNKCGMYPILPNNTSDTVKPTNLQNSILENLKIINSDDPNIQSLVIQQLSNIIVYPYGIRSRIEKKLSNNKLVKYKLPSFVAVSHLALDLLVTKFDAVTDFAQLVNDNGVAKCLRALLEIMESKAEGVPGKSSPVWIEATNLLITIVGRLVNQPNVGNDDDEELWRLVIQSVELCIKSDDKDQDVNIKHYNQLIGLVLPKLLERDDDNTELLDGFVSQIYEHSYLYKPNDLESRLMASESNQDVVDNLTSYKFDEYFGTTERLEKYSNLRIRLNNLQELIKFVHHDDSNLHLVSETYLLLRASFTLRRLINDVRLVYKCPLPIIQQRELMMLLNGINDMESVSEANRPEFKKLYRLLIQLIPYTSRITGLDGVLPKVLIKIST